MVLAWNSKFFFPKDSPLENDVLTVDLDLEVMEVESGTSLCRLKLLALAFI